METHPRLTLTGLSAITLLVSGCAGTTTHYRNAVHPSYGQAEFDRDNYKCQRENQHQVVFAMGGMAQANDVVDDRMAAMCFAALGWRKIELRSMPVTQPRAITGANAQSKGYRSNQECFQLFGVVCRPWMREP